MPTIRLNLKALEPVLATSFQSDPNSDVSYDYIPGSMIRGLLIGCYLRQHNQRELNLHDPEVQRLFFDSEHTRYLNAYLVSQDNRRMLPVPRSWHKPKVQQLTDDTPIEITDFSVEDALDDAPESPKSVAGQFWTREGGRLRLYKPTRRFNIHNQRDRRKGRSSKKEGNKKSEGEIFRYDALDAGQIFESAILCDEQDIPLFETLLNRPDLWIGGSRSAGYGHVRVTHEVINKWQEIREATSDRDDEDNLTITLLSDTLLRDPNGQPMANPSLIQSAIADVLGIELTSRTIQIFSSSTLIGGFNRKWGLPLPQVPALEAGTVIVFEDTTLTAEQIRELEWRGIGDRRNEGFGRVAVNWHRQETFKGYKPESKKAINQPTIASDSPSFPMAKMMAKRLLSQRLDRYLQKVVNDHKLKRDEKTGLAPISNSQ
ncbi:MAG: RAMP superfamily CRISPR-associated protein, partial [Cyanobacteria bacterium P01_F01_bin.150]